MTEVITSLENPRVKAALQLRRTRGRKLAGEILIDGCREIGRALEAGVRIREVFRCPELLAPEAMPSLDRAAGLRVTDLARQVFAKVAYGDRADGLIAVAARPALGLDDLTVDTDALVAVIEGLGKPGNLGAILRTAYAAGIHAVIAAEPAADIYGPNVIRASLGTIFFTRLVQASVDDTVGWLKNHRFGVVAASPDGEKAFSEIDYTGRTAIVLGSESRGLSEAWAETDIVRASIPMRKNADSLNVSASAALFFYEALRQRG